MNLAFVCHVSTNMPIKYAVEQRVDVLTACQMADM